MEISFECSIVELRLYPDFAEGVLVVRGDGRVLADWSQYFPFNICSKAAYEVIRKGNGRYRVTCGLVGSNLDRLETCHMRLEILTAEEL